jgi:N-acetylmuramoyl-L-alanine amidase
MLPFAIYLLKVTICSGILFGYYWLLLRNKIFHQYNRFYLLAIVLLSLSLPVIEINIWHASNAPAPQAIQLLQVVNSSNEYLDEIIVTSTPADISTEQILALLYSSITLVFLGVFIHTIFRIFTLFKKNRHSLVENVCFVNTTAKGTPFSFLRYIFWNDYIDPESATGHQIFKHELAHVQQKHSYDKLFINATLIVCWVNPFFWLVRKELNMIHEFMADKIAVEDSDTGTFAAMILQATYPQHRFHLTNPFFYSPIKRRLLMLTKNKNPKVSYIGRILVLPLAALVFAAFTLKAKPFKNNDSSFYNGKKITVVIDAAFGGNNLGWHSSTGINEKDINLSIAQKIKALNSNENIRIVLSRNNDIDAIAECQSIVANNKADFLITISLAQNVNNNKERGWNICIPYETAKYFKQSEIMGSILFANFSDNYGLPAYQNKLLKRAWVTTYEQCPSIMIQPGHITNMADFNYFNEQINQEKIASKILAAIERYLNQKGIIKEVDIEKKATLLSSKDTMPKKASSDTSLVKMKMIKEIYKGTKIESIYLRNKDNKLLVILAGNRQVVIEQQEAYNEKLIAPPPPPPPYGASSALANSVRVTLKDDLDALYVLNGKIQEDNFNPNSLSTDDINQMNVLKGQAAFDKYGDKGKNGVIEITTKNNIVIQDIKLTEVPVTNSLNEVVMVGYGSFDTKNEQNTQNEPIFTKTEKEPSFPGGQPAWVRYLQKNLNPNLPIEEGWKPGVYKIVFSFIVRKDGTLADIKTNDYPDSKTAEHCIDLIRKGPKWEPAVQNGHLVNAYKKQPITFVVEKN